MRINQGVLRAEVTDTFISLTPTLVSFSDQRHGISAVITHITSGAISYSPDGFFFGNFLKVMILPEAEK